jgi:hypothetical protein
MATAAGRRAARDWKAATAIGGYDAVLYARAAASQAAVVALSGAATRAVRVMIEADERRTAYQYPHGWDAYLAALQEEN